MAVNETPDALERATEAMRADEETATGWAEVSRSVVARVRDVVRPAASVLVFAADGRDVHDDHGSRVRISERVLVPALRSVVDTPTRAVDRIELDVVDDRCAGVRLDLVCSYGEDLADEGRSARAAVEAVLHDLVGPDPAFDAAQDVQVTVVDVVDGDPHATS